MSTTPKDQLLESSYDGIQEYDNDLPRWWVWLFIITVVFSGIYTVYVHGLNTPTDAQTVAQQMEELKLAQETFAKAHAPAAKSADDLLALAQKSDVVAAGQQVFAARCVACHGAKGEGLVGPNLTDNAWIHGGSIEKIHAIVENGVLEKGMLAWKGVISPDEIDRVVAYIWSIRNTNVPGKPAQGSVE